MTYRESDLLFGNIQLASISISKGYKGEWIVSLMQGFAPVTEIEEWCYATMGEPGHDRKYRWRMKYVDRNKIFIRNEQDVLMFRLRWC